MVSGGKLPIKCPSLEITVWGVDFCLLILSMYLFNIKVWKIYIYKKAAPKIVSKSLDGLSEF